MIDYLQLKIRKLHRFQAKVPVYSERGPYILKTIDTPEELMAAFRLRFEVFYHEMMGAKKKRGLDIDAFDSICDHLIIKDKTNNTIVGTYRLNCSVYSKNFYSAQEFNLRKIYDHEGPYLELGRACIHRDYRNGIIIALLWRGIAEYMTKVNANLLFGCASIKTEDPRTTALLYRYFESKGYFRSEYFCPPTLRYNMPELGLWIARSRDPLTEEESALAESLVPALCKSYLKAGAYLGGEPAYDPDFKCIDFLTILPRENLNKALWRKFSPCQTTTPETRPSVVAQASNF